MFSSYVSKSICIQQCNFISQTNKAVLLIPTFMRGTENTSHENIFERTFQTLLAKLSTHPSPPPTQFISQIEAYKLPVDTTHGVWTEMFPLFKQSVFNLYTYLSFITNDIKIAIIFNLLRDMFVCIQRRSHCITFAFLRFVRFLDVNIFTSPSRYLFSVSLFCFSKAMYFAIFDFSPLFRWMQRNLIFFMLICVAIIYEYLYPRHWRCPPQNWIIVNRLVTVQPSANDFIATQPNGECKFMCNEPKFTNNWHYHDNLAIGG